MAAQEDDLNPIEMILHNEEDEGNRITMLSDTAATAWQQHYIRSIESTVPIRQLPCEGIPFQDWPAATTLLTLLDNHRCYPNKSPLTPAVTDFSNDVGGGGNNDRKLIILELVSYTGLLGISTAAIFGSNLTVTDLPHVVPNLQFNVDANADVIDRGGGTIVVVPLRRGEDDDVEVIRHEFYLVLAFDVVYHVHLFEPLIGTLRSLFNNGDGCEKRALIMAHSRRWKKESGFFKKANKYFDVQTVYTDPPKEGGTTKELGGS